MRRAQTLLGAPATIYGYEGSRGLVTETATTTEKGLGSRRRIFPYRLHPNFNTRDNYERRDIRGREYALLQRMNKVSTTCERKKGTRN